MNRGGAGSSGAARNQFRPPSFLRRADGSGESSPSVSRSSSSSRPAEGSIQRLSSAAGSNGSPFQRGPTSRAPPPAYSSNNSRHAEPSRGGNSSDSDDDDVFAHSINAVEAPSRGAHGARDAQASSSSSRPESPSKSGDIEYWMCMWRKPQGRKHKTWDGDAVLIVDRGRGTCKLKCQESGRELGFTSNLAGKVFESGAEMTLGGKELEIDHEISQREYLAGIPDSYQWPASTKSLTKQANSRASPVAPAASPPSRLMAPAPAASFYSKPLPKPKFKDPSHRGFSPEVIKALEREEEAQEREREQEEAAAALKASKKSNSKSSSSSSAAASTSKSSTSSSSASKSRQTRNETPPQPHQNGLFNRMDAAEPRYDPLAPNAIVMERPNADHQKRFNKRENAVVDVVINPILAQHLRPHQVAGVKFLYNRLMGLVNDEGSRGAILADEMGLGKTLQTITLVETLLRQSPYYSSSRPRVIDKALIVCPLSLVKNWQREFRKWLGNNGMSNIGVVAIDGNKGKEVTQRFVTSKRDSVLIIGYEKLRTCMDILASAQPPIGLIVCDEGHRLKSKDAKTTKMFEQMSTDRRLILTGTPIQNDLSELYAMIDFVCPDLLGDYNTFKKVFEDPILKSRTQFCSREERELGQSRSTVLGDITKIVVLRRTADILDGYLRPKTEAIVFCSPAPVQVDLYRHVLRSTEVRALTSGGSGGGSAALPLITILRQVCDTPELLLKDVEGKGGGSSNGKTTLAHEVLQDTLDLFPTKRISGDVNLSGKLIALSRMLKVIKDTTDDKVVLVSTFSSTLDVLEAFCKRSKYPFERLDGKTKQDDRINLVNSFNRSPRTTSFVFLLSTKAGGVGINLVGANRLFLMEPEWNPALDQQAMARIHRDGQKKHSFIYRMMIAGTMDEKILQRQIQKLGLSDTLMGGSGEAEDEDDEDGGGGSSSTKKGKRKRSAQSPSATKKKGKGGGDSFTPEELKDIFTLHEDTPCLCHDLLLCSCGGRGELVRARPQQAGGGSSDDEDEDDDPLARGFVPASQHTAEREVQQAREARARLAGLADWRHVETISGRRTGGGEDGKDEEEDEQQAEEGIKASLAALADDTVLSAVVRRQHDSARDLRAKKRLEVAAVTKDASAATTSKEVSTSTSTSSSRSILDEMDLDALEASVEAAKAQKQKERAAKAAALEDGRAVGVSGGWRIEDEEPGNIVYVLSRMSGGDKEKDKKGGKKGEGSVGEEDDSDEEDVAAVQKRPRQQHRQAQAGPSTSRKTLQTLDEEEEEEEDELLFRGSEGDTDKAPNSSSSGTTVGAGGGGFTTAKATKIKIEPGAQTTTTTARKPTVVAPSQFVDDFFDDDAEDEEDMEAEWAMRLAEEAAAAAGGEKEKAEKKQEEETTGCESPPWPSQEEEEEDE